MRKCDVCYRNIPLFTKTCPICGAKLTKPLYKKIWFWVLVVAIITFIGKTPKKENTNAPQEDNIQVEVNEDLNNYNENTYIEDFEDEKIDNEYLEEDKEDEEDDNKYSENEDEDKDEDEEDDNIKSSNDYKSALDQAKAYSEMMYMSKEGIYEQLTSKNGGNFDEEAAEYAIDKLEDVDWNNNALETAKSYKMLMKLSKDDIYEKLIKKDKFTKSQAQYAINNLE